MTGHYYYGKVARDGGKTRKTDYNSVSLKLTTLRQYLIFAKKITTHERSSLSWAGRDCTTWKGPWNWPSIHSSHLIVELIGNYWWAVIFFLLGELMMRNGTERPPGEQWRTADVGECYKINKTYINIIRVKQYLIAIAGEGKQEQTLHFAFPTQANLLLNGQ